MSREKRKQRVKMVTVWVPHELVTAMDLVIQTQDIDRSKLIRQAIRKVLEDKADPALSGFVEFS
jgi:metal-responsive CopG/Arc/MetJ family transcriptional regulator